MKIPIPGIRRPGGSPRALRLLRTLVSTGALAVLLGKGGFDMVDRSCRLLAEAGRWGKLTPGEARQRTFGVAYTDAIDAIRRDLPGDAWYLLFPPRPPTDPGWAMWVRYDLAPRRPVLIESRHGLSTANGMSAPRWVRWAVLAGEDGMPQLATRDAALARLGLSDRP